MSKMHCQQYLCLEAPNPANLNNFHYLLRNSILALRILTVVCKEYTDKCTTIVKVLPTFTFPVCPNYL